MFRFCFTHQPLPLHLSRLTGRTLGTANRVPVSVISYTGGRRVAASRFNQAGQVSSTGGTAFSLEASPRVVGRPSFLSENNLLVLYLYSLL